VFCKIDYHNNYRGFKKAAIEILPVITEGSFGTPCTAPPNIIVDPFFMANSFLPTVNVRVAPSGVTGPLKCGQ
jgi:hypothetical protein